jgi:GntR family transcriptional regulator/MocR family aminotransferase
MARQATLVALPMIRIDADSAMPRYRQLYDGLRGAILAGQLAPGTRLPSTRALAAELDLARNTVVNAFEQLIAEGYLEGKAGAGTRVAATLPDDLLRAPAPKPPVMSGAKSHRALSQRGALLAGQRVAPAPPPRGPFRTGADYGAFPFAIWAQIAARHWRQPATDLLAYGDPAGYGPLRAALAAYLGEARGVRCTPEQVIITTGAQQGLDLAARLLLDPGEAVWMEDPAYPSALAALRAAGARIVPVPVGTEGLEVAAGIAAAPAARLVYVSPSHHYPLGVMLSLGRRLALLDWAAREGAWVLEDDYDSEYRYVGRPLAALQGLDRAGRVIYIGTFSKVLFPALRLGYVVAPPDLVPSFAAARAVTDRHSPTVEQAILADFIAEGHFARHIRRMRALYAARQAALIEAARHEIGDHMRIAPAEAGMHVIAWLPDSADDRALDALTPHPRRGLLLGYAAHDAEAIRAGMRRLGQVLRAARLITS